MHGYSAIQLPRVVARMEHLLAEERRHPSTRRGVLVRKLPRWGGPRGIPAPVPAPGHWYIQARRCPTGGRTASPPATAAACTPPAAAPVLSRARATGQPVGASLGVHGRDERVRGHAPKICVGGDRVVGAEVTLGEGARELAKVRPCHPLQSRRTNDHVLNLQHRGCTLSTQNTVLVASNTGWGQFTCA